MAAYRKSSWTSSEQVKKFIPLFFLLLGIGSYFLFKNFNPKKSGYFGGIPSEVNNFINNAEFQELKNSNVKITTGENPPKIEGTYHLNSLKVKYDKRNVYPVGRKLDSYLYIFSQQTNEGKIQLEIKSDGAGNDTVTAENAYISGADSCFTVFMDQKGTYKGCNYQTPAIISGCLTEKGVSDFEETIFMKQKECDDQKLMPIGNIRSSTESDGLAEKQ